MEETLKCDRCGEIYHLYEYNNFTDIEMRVWGIGAPQDYEFRLCPSCMEKLKGWLKPNKEKPDDWNKNEWNSMTTQPQCGVAVEIKLENGDLDIAYRRYNDKRWFQSRGEWVSSDVKIVAWRYID